MDEKKDIIIDVINVINRAYLIKAKQEDDILEELASYVAYFAIGYVSSDGGGMPQTEDEAVELLNKFLDSGEYKEYLEIKKKAAA